jgi:hypothetical protein
VKHFTEKTRIQEINRLYSTLEKVNDQFSISDDESKAKIDESKFQINEGAEDKWERNSDDQYDGRSDNLEDMAATLY